jgi:tRNA nucleotidyltransferase/poly(A) polymerase
MNLLNPKIQMQLVQIFMILDTYSQNNYLVGGSVRDTILHKEPSDYDFVTDIPMDKLEEIFKEAGWAVSTTGKAFLVLSISKDNEQYEVANYRKDGVYSDGRRPDSVSIGTLEEDAKRRDFTINALYMRLDGTILDPLSQGTEDLEKKILRFIGRPEDRIKEDYLRVFRFYRFLAKGYRPDPKSLVACRTLFNEAYEKTTPERVRAELEKLI